MKLLIPAFLFLCVGSTNAFAQAKIEQLWGGKGYDGAFSAAATADGGYIISGLTQSGDEKTGDIIVVKTTAHGDTMWTLKVGGPKLEGGNYVIQTSDGGYMVSGHTEDFGAMDCDAFLLKLDKAGKQEWMKVYGGEHDDISEGVVELPGQGYVFAGITENYGFGPGVVQGQDSTRNIYFVKTNLAGDTLWTKAYGGPGKEYAYSIVHLQQGGFLAAGFSNSFGNGSDNAWLLRLKENGDTLWTRLYPTTAHSRFFQILPTKDGGYMLAGYKHLPVTDKSQGFMVKLDNEGQEQWEKTYGAGDDVAFQGVAQLPNGNYMFSGTSHKQGTAGAAYILTTTDQGEAISEQYFGGNNSYVNCIAIHGNSSYLIAGVGKQVDGDGDLYYVERDATIAGIPETHAVMASVFPNPAKDILTIMLPAALSNESTTISIMDIRGQLVYNQANDAGRDIVFDCSATAPGLYTYRIVSQHGNMLNGTFVIK